MAFGEGAKPVDPTTFRQFWPTIFFSPSFQDILSLVSIPFGAAIWQVVLHFLEKLVTDTDYDN